MVTTIKISEETRERILSLDLAGKGKTFDMIVNDLITFYTKTNKQYVKEHKKYEATSKSWEKQHHEYERYLHTYGKQNEKRKKTWEKMLKWAKSQGFKE